MTFIDERGRLFGRFNFIDTIVVLLVLAILGFVGVGYSLFRLPRAPVVGSFDPPSFIEGKEQRVQLNGRNFLPYLRAFVNRTNQTDFVKRPGEHESQDNFTIVNATRVPFLLETPTLAELELPPLPAGTYDVGFYDDTKLVAVKTAAFVVTALPQRAGPQWDATGSVLVYGAFTNLKSDEVFAVRAGAHAMSGGVDWADVLAVEPPRPDITGLQIQDRTVPAAVIGRVQVPAKMRVRCWIYRTECRVDGVTIVPGALLSGTIDARPVTFRVSEVGSALPQRERDINLTVRFVARREIVALVRPGARDVGHGSPMLPEMLERGATIKSVGEIRTMTGQATLNLNDVGLESFTVDEPLVTVDADLVVPTTEIGGVWMYKTLPVRAGGVLLFENAQYAIRGWILRTDNADTPVPSKRAPR